MTGESGLRSSWERSARNWSLAVFAAIKSRRVSTSWVASSISSSTPWVRSSVSCSRRRLTERKCVLCAPSCTACSRVWKGAARGRHPLDRLVDPQVRQVRAGAGRSRSCPPGAPPNSRAISRNFPFASSTCPLHAVQQRDADGHVRQDRLAEGGLPRDPLGRQQMIAVKPADQPRAHRVQRHQPCRDDRLLFHQVPYRLVRHRDRLPQQRDPFRPFDLLEGHQVVVPAEMLRRWSDRALCSSAGSSGRAARFGIRFWSKSGLPVWSMTCTSACSAKVQRRQPLPHPLDQNIRPDVPDDVPVLRPHRRDDGCAEPVILGCADRPARRNNRRAAASPPARSRSRNPSRAAPDPAPGSRPAACPRRP